MREREIEAYLVKQVQATGGEVRKVKWIGRRGAPDRLVMLPPSPLRSKGASVLFPGRLLWVELKAPGKKAEPHQMREHARLHAMGQRVVVIDSLEAVDSLMGPF